MVNELNESWVITQRSWYIYGYTCSPIINLGKSVKVLGMSKQIDLIRNTDRQKRQNLYYVIDIGCRYDKKA